MFSKISNILKYIRKKIVKIHRYPLKFNKGKQIILYSLYVFATFLLYLILVDINFLYLFGKSPKIVFNKMPYVSTSTEIYYSDSVLLGKYYKQNRKLVTYEEISPEMLTTLVTTEDVRFYKHHGVDYKATFSILWNYIRKGEKRGGSTITQQLVKNLFKTRTNYSQSFLGAIPGIRTIILKTKEWIAAVKIEMLFTKEEILTMYLNTMNFGNNSYGIYSASKVYFNKLPAELGYTESALLVGLLKAPTLYNPFQNPETAMKRRNVVLKQLQKYEVVNEKECDSLLAHPLNTSPTYEKDNASTGYFKSAVADFLKEWCKENNYNLYTDGLKIYTSLDSRMQKYAEEAATWQMSKLQKIFINQWKTYNRISKENKYDYEFIKKLTRDSRYFKKLEKLYPNKDTIVKLLNNPRKMKIFTWNGDRDTIMSSVDSLLYYYTLLQTGFVAIEPETGFVKAWIGGNNYNYFMYDHVAKSRRQPGSTFKAFVYAAAFDNGYGPCDRMTDVPVSIKFNDKNTKRDTTWYPQNATWVFTYDTVSLKYGFAKSINSLAVQLTKKVGWNKVIEYAYKSGIKTKLEDVPSVCLGSSDVSLLELVNAYCPFINGGYRIEPVLVTKIIDHDGKVVYDYKQEKEKVYSDETAFLMREMLKAGLTEPGATTQALWAFDIFRYNTEFGGKTGTSSDHCDGWFVGVSPKLAGGCWVGADDRSVHFYTSQTGDGSHTALPVFGKFMEKVLKDEKLSNYRAKFPKPDFNVKKSYSCHTVIKKTDTLQTEAIQTE